MCVRVQDHKPSREDETERIKGAGGMVIHKRVMGELAVSRAFGDRAFKIGIKVRTAKKKNEEKPQPRGQHNKQFFIEFVGSLLSVRGQEETDRRMILLWVPLSRSMI